jgi:hypothetical protein
LIYDYFEDRYVTVALSRTELEHLIARVPARGSPTAEVYAAANWAHLGDMDQFVAIVGCEGPSSVTSSGSELLIRITRQDLANLAVALSSDVAAALYFDGDPCPIQVEVLAERDGTRSACVLTSRQGARVSGRHVSRPNRSQK